MRRRIIGVWTIAAVAAWIGGVGVAWAAEPVGWRHDGTGVYPAEAPTAWDLETGQGVLWRAPLPAWSNASPLVVGDRVFVTSEPTDLVALAVDDGRLLWRKGVQVVDALAEPEAQRVKDLLAEASGLKSRLREARRAHRKLLRKARKAKGADKQAAATALEAAGSEITGLEVRLEATRPYRLDPRNDTVGYASSTPVSDGRTVYAVFANGVVAAYATSGKRRWARWMGEPHVPMRGNPEGHAASPVLAGGRLVVGLRLLHGLDPTTGGVVWRAGVYDDFGTPVALKVGGTPAVATPGGEVHRASDGALLAQVDVQLFYSGPVADDTRLYFVGSTSGNAGDYGSVATGFATADLNASGARVAPTWRTPLGRERYYATALVSAGRLYAVDHSGHLTVLDAGTGEVLQRLELSTSEVSPSPAMVGGALAVVGEDGRVVIGPATPRFEPSVQGTLPGGRPTPYWTGTRMYVRAEDALLCIGR